MLFKKGVLPQSKDIVAETYASALEEHRKKIREKTDEIRKCIQDRRAAESIENGNLDSHDQNGSTDKAL